MRQMVLTPAMGKRLIGRAMAAHPAVGAVLKSGTLVIVAGTTNGYVAEEVLRSIGQAEGFSRAGFRRGIVLPPGVRPPEAKFSGDVVIANGKWLAGKTMFDVDEGLHGGDLILKGANALDLSRGRAGVLVEHAQAGTAMAAVRAVAGRRAQLIVPVGLEKRVADDIADLAAWACQPDVQGPRLLQLPGTVFTELDAIALLTGCSAKLLAAGGYMGAEGAVWLGVSGSPDQLAAVSALAADLAAEPPCQA